MFNFQKIDEKYKSIDGDKLAAQELLPVVLRFIPKNPKILEIGCGYGRNLVALAKIPGSTVIGCDTSKEELAKAEDKIRSYGNQNASVMHQETGNRLPFANREFDFVVIWQVLEHVFKRKDKKALLHEARRVVKKGGYILIETPNFYFPFDYHDNNLPLVHWVFPTWLRKKITQKIRKKSYTPSEYTNIYEIKKFLGKQFRKQTNIFFESKYSDIFRHLGGSRLVAKKIFFTLYYPIYFILRLAGISGDLFTPSIRVVFRKK